MENDFLQQGHIPSLLQVQRACKHNQSIGAALERVVLYHGELQTPRGHTVIQRDISRPYDPWCDLNYKKTQYALNLSQELLRLAQLCCHL